MSISGPSRMGSRDLVGRNKANGDPNAISWREYREKIGKAKDRWEALKLVSSATGYTPLPHQLRAHTAVAPQKLLLGGIGSGKTIWSVAEMLTLCILNPGVSGAFFAPTFDAVVHVLLPEWTRMVDAMAVSGYPIQRRFHKSMAKAELIGGGTIYFRSFERVDSCRGWTLGFAAVDETESAADPQYVWNVISGRIRDPSANIHQMHATTTPRGLRGTVQKFIEQRGIPELKSDWWCGRATTRDNPHLPPGYLKSLKGYSKRLWEQEVEAKVLKPSNTVFGDDWGAHNVRPWVYDRALPYDLAVDWGYSKPHALWIQRTHDGEGIIFDEYYEDEVPRDVLRKVIKEKCERLGKDPEYAIGDRAVKDQMSWLLHQFPSSYVKRMHTKKEQSILEGIEIMRAMMDPIEGPPKLFIAENIMKRDMSRCISNCIAGYRWAQKRDGAISDYPLKGVYDDGVDALRYWSVVHNDSKTDSFVLRYGGGDNWKNRKRLF
jgi:hypothetical protein